MKPNNILRYLLIGTLALNTVFSNAIADVKFLEDNQSQGSYVGSGTVNAPQIGNLIDVPPLIFKNREDVVFYWFAPLYYQDNPPIATNKRFDGNFVARKFRTKSFTTENSKAIFWYWQAKSKLQNRTPASRRIITGDGILKNNGSAGKGTHLFTSALPVQLRNKIHPSPARANAIINYMRGGTAPGNFTVRTSKLGQVINSNILYHKHNKNRQLVYFGADDGMLHALNAETGEEEFAYIPSAVLPNLDMLVTETGYDTSKRPLHTVDGKIAIYTIKNRDKVERTILVGTLGKGLKGLYALDITEGGAQTKVLWEHFSGDTIGYMEGVAEIAESRGERRIGLKPVVFIGNGLGSNRNRATLLGIHALNGEIELSMDAPEGATEAPSRGLYAPALTDLDLRGAVDYAYAADSSGKIIRFKLEKPDHIRTIYSKQNPNRHVLVSSKPAIMRHPKGGDVVSVVTSRQDNTSTPEVVGIWSQGLDDPSDKIEIKNFDTRNANYSFYGNGGRALEGDPEKIKVNWNHHSGWRVNLEEGEIIRHQDAFQFNGRLYFASTRNNANHLLNRIGIIDPTWSACGKIIYPAEGNGTDKQCKDQHFISELYERRLLVQPNIILLDHTAFRPRKVDEVWREDFRR